MIGFSRLNTGSKRLRNSGLKCIIMINITLIRSTFYTCPYPLRADMLLLGKVSSSYWLQATIGANRLLLPRL